MRGRTPDPNSVSGRIRAMIAEAKAPVSTRDVAERFGIANTVASALLNQCRKRGMIRQVFRGTIGHKAKPAMWAPVASTPFSPAAMHRPTVSNRVPDVEPMYSPAGWYG